MLLQCWLKNRHVLGLRLERKVTKDFFGRLYTTSVTKSVNFNNNKLPKYADAVVIGGGSIGTSVLYHLQKKGLNSILLESNNLTAGTTWHSAGKYSFVNNCIWGERRVNRFILYFLINLYIYIIKVCYGG